jgi:hypothetical protein
MAHFIAVPIDALNVAANEANLHSVKSSDGFTRYRCDGCGSPLFSHSHLDHMKFRDFPAALVEGDMTGLEAGAHIFYRSKRISIKDGLPKFESFPGQGTLPE